MKNSDPLRDANAKLALTPAEFAAPFGRSKTWTYRLLYAGKLKRLAGTPAILIPRAELERFLADLTVHK